MLSTPRRRRPDSSTIRAGRSTQPTLSKVEALERRDLMATAGSLHATAIVAPPLPLPTPPPPILVSPTSGPAVGFIQFEPLTGRVLVTFTGDMAGYDRATLTNPDNYSFTPVAIKGSLPNPDPSRPRAGVVLAPQFVVTGVNLASPVAPGQPQLVVVSINNNQPIRDGVYFFNIRAAGITDRAGRPLDGTYFGTFPTGNGQGGGDFQALLAQTRHTVIPALPITSTSSPLTTPGVTPTYVFLPSTQATTTRYAAANPPGGFMLAGGNNIKLIPLAHQNYPGTYRLPAPKPPRLVGKAAKHHS